VGRRGEIATTQLKSHRRCPGRYAPWPQRRSAAKCVLPCARMDRLDFRLEATATGSRARAARFNTAHNEVLTPTFMPVGTHAAVRAQRREDVLESGAQVLLANTYHLMLRPGVEMFEKFGGIHRFMNWPRSVLTDSGGFQIFSLPGSRSITEEGAEFKSYVDQTVMRLSPESSIAAQRSIGSDIMMVLDQCVPSTVERGARAAMELTHRWALRSLAARGDSPQACSASCRGRAMRICASRAPGPSPRCPSTGLPSAALAVGESAASARIAPPSSPNLLPQDRPRYLMGVGTTRDLLEAVHRGVDMFDCILPTALAKQGVAFTSMGRRDLRRAAYRDMDGPIDPACDCHTCKTYSIAYLVISIECASRRAGSCWGAQHSFLYAADAHHAHHILAAPGSSSIARSATCWTRAIATGGADAYHQGAATRAQDEAGPLRSGRGRWGRTHSRQRLGRSHAFGQRSGRRGAFAVCGAVAFKHLRHAAPRRLLADNRWVSPTENIEWLLLRGDFAANKFAAPLPDVIFFDPFSFKTDGALWTLMAFRELAELLGAKAVELFTYSYSTSVRAAMLAAGFFVAKGRGTGPKAETTIGLTPPAAARAHGRELLGEEWLGKWRRSDAQAPMGVVAHDESWLEAVAKHPQFLVRG
jgi:tRNA-guanine transglycosylase